MELSCPCGRGSLIRNVTKKDGANHGRPYCKCPAGCGFYSFEDELKECRCKRGFCRTKFIKGKKYWQCCVEGPGGCDMNEEIKSTWQSLSFTPPSSPSSPYQFSGSSSSGQGAAYQYSGSSSSGQGAGYSSQRLKINNDMLLKAVEVTQTANGALTDLLVKLCKLEE